MEPWVIPLLSLVVGVIGGVIGAHVGVRVAIGKLEVRVASIDVEIERLRQAKHDHANILTQHSLRLRMLDGQDES